MEKTSKNSVEWTRGLNTKVANALISAGYNSKDEIKKDLENGVIGVILGTEKGKIMGIGRRSILELSVWADVLSEDQEVIQNAIQLLASHGYVATKA